MKLVHAFLILAATMLPMISFASEDLPCKEQVTTAIQGDDMFDVVEQVHSTDGKDYVVIFRTASGDAEQASVAVVTVDPSNCSIENVKYVRGSH